MRKRSSSSSTLRAVARAEADVAQHVEMREERVLLEQVADAPALRRDVDAAARVEQDGLAERDDAALRPQQPGDDAQHRRLPGARRPDERERLARLDGQVGRRVEAAKRVSEPDAERHRVVSLTERRTSALIDDQERADRERDVEVDVELLVDRERERLRDPLQRAGEHDRRAELAEPAREGERGARAEAAARERQHHAEEDAARPGAERAGGGRQRRIDGLERGDGGAEVEGARDEGHREDRRPPS